MMPRSCCSTGPGHCVPCQCGGIVHVSHTIGGQQVRHHPVCVVGTHHPVCVVGTHHPVCVVGTHHPVCV